MKSMKTASSLALFGVCRRPRTRQTVKSAETSRIRTLPFRLRAHRISWLKNGGGRTRFSMHGLLA
jgi:hypothetical protein